MRHGVSVCHRYRQGRARSVARLAGRIDHTESIHRAAIVEPADIGALLRAIEDYDGLRLTKAALKLAPLVFVRPGELRQAEWAEFDLEHAEWRIPAAKMKMRRLHRVPLSKQALAIIHDLQAFSRGGRWLFPSVHGISQPMSENTLNAALRRLGYSKGQMTAHGFKGMASTRLNEMGCWNPDAIERQLAHQESDDVRGAYMHSAERLPDGRRRLVSLSEITGMEGEVCQMHDHGNHETLRGFGKHSQKAYPHTAPRERLTRARTSVIR